MDHIIISNSSRCWVKSPPETHLSCCYLGHVAASHWLFLRVLLLCFLFTFFAETARHEAASHLSVKHGLAPVRVIIMGVKVYAAALCPELSVWRETLCFHVTADTLPVTLGFKHCEAFASVSILILHSSLCKTSHPSLTEAFEP